MPLLTNPDPLEARALADFDEKHPKRKFEEIAFVIPSYREVKSLPKVLTELPRELLGKKVSILVIIDGDDDGAAAVAEQHGAFVTFTGGHRGQGAALRLGYRLASSRGSRYLVSVDADGQYLPSEIETVLAPVVAGEADFVSGSRRLGNDQTTDQVRSLGIDVFAGIIRVLTRHPVTDPAFGLRAMTAELTQKVTLEQPQYQASELLVGAILNGFRVTERPATLRKRGADKSRKGPNLLYGMRFARVVLRTWWRDR